MSFAIGSSLVLNGIAGIIAPVPKTPEMDSDPRENFNFSGVQNTSRSGVVVPVIYGEVVTRQYHDFSWPKHRGGLIWLTSLLLVRGGGGGKGGGGGGGSADVTPDSLDSRQIARVVDLLCEGEIEGFPSGKEFNGQLYNRDTAEYNFGALKDVFFDNTQVVRQGADPSNQQPTDYNFDVTTDAVYEFRYGQQDQSVLTNLDVLNQATFSVNTKVA